MLKRIKKQKYFYLAPEKTSENKFSSITHNQWFDTIELSMFLSQRLLQLCFDSTIYVYFIYFDPTIFSIDLILEVLGTSRVLATLLGIRIRQPDPGIAVLVSL